jgi:carbon monoxide dehydrogenase subunit G
VFEVSASRDIPASPATVWEMLRDTQHYAEWVAGTEAVSRTDGPAALGVTYEEINPIIGPWKATSRWDVTEYEEGRRMVHSSADLPLTRDFRVVMEVTEAGTRTRVTMTLRAEESLGPVGWLFGKAMAPLVGRDNRTSLVNLEKRLITTVT